MKTITTIAALFIWLGIITCVAIMALKLFILGVDWLKDRQKATDKSFRNECMREFIVDLCGGLFCLAIAVFIACSPFI